MIFQSRQSGPTGAPVSSSEATRVGQFIRLNSLTFTYSKVDEDPQGFIDEIEKFFLYDAWI